MYTALLLRGARGAAVAALALTTGLTGISTADATDHKGTAPVPIEVKIGASGIQAPDSAPGGLVTFHVTTDDPAGRGLQVFRPNDGVSVDQVLDDFTKAVTSADPADTASAIAAVQHDAQLLSGATVTPAVAGSATTEITPGTVYLMDFTAFFEDPSAPVIRALELCAGPSANLAEFPDGIVIEEETAGGPRFRTENVTLADGHFLVRNASDQIHEMMLQRVPDGTTDEQLQAFFDAILAGNPPPDAGPPDFAVGLGAMSPGRTALYHAENLPPGTYALICFIPDHENGLPHAFLGMHKVVVLA